MFIDKIANGFVQTHCLDCSIKAIQNSTLNQFTISYWNE